MQKHDLPSPETSSSNKELAIIETIPKVEYVTDVEVLEADEIKDASRVDNEYARHIEQKVIDMINESKPAVREETAENRVKKIEFSEGTAKDFEEMFTDDLLQRLAEGKLKERELSEACVVAQVFANGWQENGTSFDIGNERLKATAVIANNLLRAIAVLDHVIPPADDDTTDDKRDSVSGFVRTAATAKSASAYIDTVDQLTEHSTDLDERLTGLIDQVAKKAFEKWPKNNGHPVGEMPMRWV